MKRNRHILMISIFVIVFLAIIPTVIVYASNDLPGLIPDSDNQSGSTGIQPIYQQYEYSSYIFDIEHKSIFHLGEDVVITVLNAINNTLFLLHVLASKFTVFILVNCYNINIFDLIPDAINKIVLAVKKGVFEGFYEIVIMLAGVYGMYMTYRAAKTTGIKVTVTSLLILGISIVFFENPSEIGKSLNKATSIICTQVLYEVSKVTSISTGEVVESENDAVVLLGNQFWNVVVMKPYELVQYGSIGEHNPVEFLVLPPDNIAREAVMKQYTASGDSKEYVMFATVQGQAIRLALTLIMSLIGLAQNVCILLITGIIVLNQIGALFWICFAGVFFLAALYPKNGFMLLINWGLETFGFLLKRIVITISLSIYFAISTSIYSLTERYGYLIVIMLNIAMLVFSIINRDKVYKLILGLLLNVNNAFTSSIQKESAGGKIAKGIIAVYAGKKIYDGFKNKMGQRERKIFDRKNSKRAYDVLTQKYNSEKESARYDAEQRLTQRYEKEKQTAEARASRTGRKPEYSWFVNGANKRKREGLPMFSEEQIRAETVESDFVRETNDRKQKGYTVFSQDRMKNTLNHMYKLKKEGNDPSRLTYTNVEGKSDDQIQTDQALKDADVKLTQIRFKKAVKENDQKIKNSIEGIYPSRNAKPAAVAGRAIRRYFASAETVRKMKRHRAYKLPEALPEGQIQERLNAVPEVKALTDGGVKFGENFVMYPGSETMGLDEVHLDNFPDNNGKSKELSGKALKGTQTMSKGQNQDILHSSHKIETPTDRRTIYGENSVTYPENETMKLDEIHLDNFPEDIGKSQELGGEALTDTLTMYQNTKPTVADQKTEEKTVMNTKSVKETQVQQVDKQIIKKEVIRTKEIIEREETLEKETRTKESVISEDGTAGKHAGLQQYESSDDGIGTAGHEKKGLGTSGVLIAASIVNNRRKQQEKPKPERAVAPNRNELNSIFKNLGGLENKDAGENNENSDKALPE